jgi:hypothetical protein
MEEVFLLHFYITFHGDNLTIVKLLLCTKEEYPEKY